MFLQYRIKKSNNKYLVQRRFLFLKWIIVAEYDDLYKANMLMFALKK